MSRFVCLWRSACIASLLILPLTAQTPTATSARSSKRLAGGLTGICGSYADRAREEIFLHQRSAATRARRSALRAVGEPVIDRNVGEIAVIGSSDGVIAGRNSFHLNSSTVTFQPGAEGYTVTSAATNTYDAAAAAAGTRIDLEDDDTAAVSLPFEFPFFGATYHDGWINSNGSISFTRGELIPEYLSLGEFTAGPPSIAPLYADLTPNLSASGVRMLAEPARLVLSWDDVPLYIAGASDDDQRFQLRLYPDGRIEFAYDFGDPTYAISGITAGNLQPADLVNLSNPEPGPFPGGIAESFTALEEVDIITTSQRFYRTHEDAYDYLVIYNATNVEAGPGAVAYEVTTRSAGEGFGDTPVNWGATFGSAERLQAVLNLGPVDQYPLDPNATVSSRRVTGDTPLTILGHETGHLWLALASVPHPDGPQFDPPMLSADRAHWNFAFNSEASLLEGNRIADNGQGALPRFRTIATVEGFSPLDQYLMGLRDASQVPPTFAILNSGQYPSRAPQAGVSMNGQRFDITVEDLAAAVGPRIPDFTVSQRAFRFAFILIVDESSDLSTGSTAARAIAQIDEYRRQFEPFFARVTSGAQAMTQLHRAVHFSLHPSGGVTLDTPVTATLRIAQPQSQPVRFSLSAQGSRLTLPSEVTIPIGATEAQFPITGNTAGVEEVDVTPADPAYQTVHARVQVNPRSALQLAVVGGDKQRSDLAPGSALPQPIAIRVQDRNHLPYAGQSVSASVNAGGSLTPSNATTDEDGIARFTWTPGPGSDNRLTASLTELPSTQATATALGRPAITGGVLSAASYIPRIAPGSFGAIFGASLAAGQLGSVSSPFPALLSGVSVRINGIAAGLVYLSDGQINFLAPANLLPGPGQLTVETPIGISDPIAIQVDAVVPGIFFDPATNAGAILISGTTHRTQEQPALVDDYLEIYSTGLGIESTAARTVTCTIGGVPVPVSYAGSTIIDGLDQVNVRVTSNVPSGSQPLVLTVNGVTSNTVFVQIAGQ